MPFVVRGLLGFVRWRLFLWLLLPMRIAAAYSKCPRPCQHEQAISASVCGYTLSGRNITLSVNAYLLPRFGENRSKRYRSTLAKDTPSKKKQAASLTKKCCQLKHVLFDTKRALQGEAMTITYSRTLTPSTSLFTFFAHPQAIENTFFRAKKRDISYAHPAQIYAYSIRSRKLAMAGRLC